MKFNKLYEGENEKKINISFSSITLELKLAGERQY